MTNLFNILSLHFIRKFIKSIYIHTHIYTLGSLIPVSKNVNQTSMMKFLTNNKCNQQNESNTKCDIFTLTSQSNNVRNTINPDKVKLLSDDNAGIDFLTLCAVKKSEEEMSSETMRKMDTTYIPVAKPVKNPFNIVIPDIQVLDSLPLLITNLINQMTIRHETSKDENTQNDNDHVNINDDNFWCTIRNERNVDTNDVRFEDILDFSSDTDITKISRMSQAISESEVISVDKNKVTGDNDEIMTNYARTKLSNNIFNNMKPSTFEHVLDDSFSSINDSAEVDDTVRQGKASSSSSNIFSKNAENMNVSSESVIDIFSDDTNADGFNQNLSASVEPAKPAYTKKSAENCIDEIQDLYFSNDDIADFACNKPNNSKSMHNTKPEESFLSITQAIQEIASMKKNLEKSPILSASKGDSSPEWISTDTKHKTEFEKKNTRLGLKNRLPYVNLNSNTKSYTAKRHFDLQNDSDEDFVITEDNVKKFDELESSYFCSTSKDQSNHLRNTLRNSVNKNDCFDDTSKVFIPGSSNLCSTSKPTIPSGMSMADDNRRPMLSLKRNKDPYSNTIDLSAFKAPSKCVNSMQERNTLGSDVSTSKQTAHLDREVSGKINKHNKKKRKKQKNIFIDDEVEVISVVSSDESISTTDEELQDFVSYTQNEENQVDMQAHYLQSTKGSIGRPGAFHFKKPKSPDPDIEIYSQALSPGQDSYLYVRKISSVYLKYSSSYIYH